MYVLSKRIRTKVEMKAVISSSIALNPLENYNIYITEAHSLDFVKNVDIYLGFTTVTVSIESSLAMQCLPLLSWLCF